MAALLWVGPKGRAWVSQPLPEPMSQVSPFPPSPVQTVAARLPHPAQYFDWMAVSSSQYVSHWCSQGPSRVPPTRKD